MTGAFNSNLVKFCHLFTSTIKEYLLVFLHWIDDFLDVVHQNDFFELYFDVMIVISIVSYLKPIISSNEKGMLVLLIGSFINILAWLVET